MNFEKIICRDLSDNTFAELRGWEMQLFFVRPKKPRKEGWKN